VVRKDGYRRDYFFPNFLATVDNIRTPTVTTDQGFLFFVFCGIKNLENISGKNKKNSPICTRQKISRKFITFWSEKRTKFVPKKKKSITEPKNRPDNLRGSVPAVVSDNRPHCF
jgi:hypothetical protein